MKLRVFNLIRFFTLLALLLLCSCESSDYSIYILSRNSQSKEGNLVLKYNLFAEDISHIGIAFDNKPNSLVYNISYDKKNHSGSSLIKEKIVDFWSSPQSKDNKIWVLSVTKKELRKAKNIFTNLKMKRLALILVQKQI